MRFLVDRTWAGLRARGKSEENRAGPDFPIGTPGPRWCTFGRLFDLESRARIVTGAKMAAVTMTYALGHGACKNVPKCDLVEPPGISQRVENSGKFRKFAVIRARATAGRPGFGAGEAGLQGREGTVSLGFGPGARKFLIIRTYSA
jgi:hypothetical protein